MQTKNLYVVSMLLLLSTGPMFGMKSNKLSLRDFGIGALVGGGLKWGIDKAFGKGNDQKKMLAEYSKAVCTFTGKKEVPKKGQVLNALNIRLKNAVQEENLLRANPINIAKSNARKQECNRIYDIVLKKFALIEQEEQGKSIEQLLDSRISDFQGYKDICIHFFGTDDLAALQEFKQMITPVGKFVLQYKQLSRGKVIEMALPIKKSVQKIIDFQKEFLKNKNQK